MSPTARRLTIHPRVRGLFRTRFSNGMSQSSVWKLTIRVPLRPDSTKAVKHRPTWTAARRPQINNC
jgi:hypothetical protein